MSDAAPGARCLRRGLMVLAELNRRRMAGAGEIGAAIGVPRPTVHRLLLALQAEGYVRQLDHSEYFVPQGRVTELAAGWDAPAEALAIATKRVDKLAGDLGWAIDLSVFDAGEMVIRHSTHDRAGWSLLPSSPIGRRLPLCGTSLGRMYLAGLSPAARLPHLRGAAEGERDAVELAAWRGYALRDGGHQPRTWSIAVPVRDQGVTVLCMGMAFIRSSTVIEKIVAEYLPLLTTIARATEADLGHEAASDAARRA